jgi:Xaa-Pro dipeptidase
VETSKSLESPGISLAPRHGWETLAALHEEHLLALGAAYGRLAEAHGLAAIVVHGGRAKKRSRFDDQYFALRSTPHFQHWVALSEHDCAIVVCPGKTPMLVWPTARDFWERPRVPTTTSFTHTRALKVERPSLYATTKELLPEGKIAFIGEDAEAAAELDIPLENMNSPELLRELDALRVSKSAYERECLAEANRIAARGHDAVRRVFLSGDASELDLHLEFLRATRQDDSETPYKNIVAKGENGAILHHIAYLREGRGEESLLLDAGATFQGYCSDITRTWVKGSSAAASTFLGVVEAFERMQQDLCAAVKVGNKYEALHDESHRRVSQVLADAKIVKLSAEEICARGISRMFYPHGLGHSLGLQCHDVGCALLRPREDNPFLRNTAIIEAGQTFTIEPGLYFIDQKLDELRNGSHAGDVDFALVDALAALGGVRIEDDLYIREGEPAENLTRAYLPVGGGNGQ